MSVKHSPTKTLSGSADNLLSGNETSTSQMESVDDGAENMVNVTER